MSFEHIAERASLALGLEVRFSRDRRHTTCNVVRGGAALVIGLPEGGDLDPVLVDLDDQHRGFILEITENDVRREPSFGLILEGSRRARYVVLPEGDEGWAMWPAGEARTVADVVGSATDPSA